MPKSWFFKHDLYTANDTSPRSQLKLPLPPVDPAELSIAYVFLVHAQVDLPHPLPPSPFH
jgi:hypothetical protein